MKFIEPYINISLSVNNLWLLSVAFLLLNTGFIVLFPKYNIGKFIKVPKIKKYTLLNQITYYLIFAVSIIIPLRTGTVFFIIGSVFFIVGILLYGTSMLYFAISEYRLPVTNGIYKFSRHPVYISFLIIVIGMILAGSSLILLIIAAFHFYTLTFIISEEEKNCEKLYGKLYTDYKQKTKKYF